VRNAIALATLALGLLHAEAAVAQSSRQSCIDSFERAQREHKDGAFLRASADFRACASTQCPAMVRKDCTDALASLSSKIPSVRVTVHSADGAEIDGYDLTIDDKPAKSGAEPIELDPGEHRIRVALEDGESSERRVTLGPGDLSVPVVITVGAAGEQPEPSRPGAEAAQTPVLAYVLGGVALLGVGGFVGFGLAGRGVEACKGSCSEQEISAIHRDFLVADVSLAVALVSGGIAGYLFFSTPKREARPAAYLGARPLRGGGTLSAGVSF
jgi:hypothetical protein